MNIEFPGTRQFSSQMLMGILISLSMNGGCSKDESETDEEQEQSTGSVASGGGGINSISAKTCAIFPSDNPWNTDISAYPKHQDSDKFIQRLSSTWRLKFVPNLPINIIDSAAQNIPAVSVNYENGGDTPSIPIPSDAVYHVKESTKLVTEDNHMVVVDNADCLLYEFWSVKGPDADGSWSVGNGSTFDLKSNALRPEGSPSSAASGLPVFAGLVRAGEMKEGVIRHALSIPATFTLEKYIHPATVFQKDDIFEAKFPLVCATANYDFKSVCDEVEAGTFSMIDPYNAPMGLRLRLKQDYDLSKVTGEAAIILQAAKTYGIFITDGSGEAGMLRGEKVSDPAVWSWSTSIDKQLFGLSADDFEVVDSGPLLP